MSEQYERAIRYEDISFLTSRPFMAQDLIRMVIGEKLGEGSYRAVYDYDLIRGVVIKVAPTPKANILEYCAWQEAKDTSYSKWLAPCIALSPCGHYLLQKKVRAIKETDKLPRRIPNFFEDIKRSNWGFIGNRFVCHDYQFIGRSMDIAFNSWRRVDWKK